jgi:hypothetical protein
MNLKKIAAVAVIILAAAQWLYRQSSAPTSIERPAEPSSSAGRTNDEAASAFADRARGRQITVQGRVERLLADDREGSRHQRFIVRTESGVSLLVAHNIDLAPRIDALREGESLRLNGEYEWSERGGVLHWTHHDPGGHHVAGYIERDGKRYQ